MNELYHHGILGQRWGIRRYQNKDGTLTEEGKKRVRDASTDIFIRDRKHGHNRMNILNSKEITMAYNLHDNDGTIDKFIDDYAKATLKDLKLKCTDDSIKIAKKAIEDNETYQFPIGPRTSEKTKCIALVKEQSASVSKDISDMMISDINRWNKEAGNNRKLSKVECEKIANKVKSNVEKADQHYVYTYKDGTFDFLLEGIAEYSDYAPMRIEYDTKTNKVKNMWYQ